MNQDCPHCGAPDLIYQTPTLYLCGLCGGYATLTGAPQAVPKPIPPNEHIVTAADFENLDERLKQYPRTPRQSK